jgi:hypothetical protein
VFTLDFNVLGYEIDEPVFTLLHHHSVKDVPQTLVDQVARFFEQLLKFFLLHGQGECLIEGPLRVRNISLIGNKVKCRREILNDANQAHAVVN